MTNQETAAGRRTGQRILLVDDEESVLFALNEYLSLRGHEVHRATSRESAESLLAEERFSWLVTDLHLTPARAGEGLEVARRARSAGVVRIVLLTAHGAPELVREAELAGIDRVIAKPVRLADLEALLSNSDGSHA